MEMLKIYNNPPRREWPALTARCTRQEGEITERVAAILSQAVSYTHLDVYKRQPLSSAIRAFSARWCGSG